MTDDELDRALEAVEAILASDPDLAQAAGVGDQTAIRTLMVQAYLEALGGAEPPGLH